MQSGTMTWGICTLLVIVLSIVWKVNCDQLCAPASRVSPCQCHTNSSITLVTCNGIDTPQDLQNLTMRIPRWKLDLLQFTECVMLFIPSAILKDAKFKSMEIADSILQNLFDSIPTQVNIEKLVLKNVVLRQGLDWNMLSKTRLKTLHIQGLPLPFIHPSLFMPIYPEEMTDLRLDNTKTTEVSSFAFSRFMRLRHFALTRSGLKKITRDVFPMPWYNIRSIDLGDNLLGTFPPDLFHDMKNLYGVALENNQIATIPELPAIGLHGNIYYNLNGNPLYCNCEMKWLSMTPAILISGECHGPSNVKTIPLNALRPSDFGC